MGLRVAIQMDPLESINPASDSTLLLGLEAQKRGYELWVYAPRQLSMLGGEVVAHAKRATLFADVKKHYEFGEEARLNLHEMDVILLRQDPPFDMAYLATTYLLERLLPDVLVVNNPTQVRNQPEKLFPSLFGQFMPPTLVSADVGEIENFRQQHKDIVIKPLFGHGGHAVLRLKEDDQNFHPLLEMIFSESSMPWMVQKFLPQVKDQERRIIIIDGEVAGVVGRLPAEGEIRSNFRVGGKPAKVELNFRQRDVCAAIGPSLKEKGLLFTGLDMIGDYLTEINITSPTGLAIINQLHGVQLQAQMWDAIERYL